MKKPVLMFVGLLLSAGLFAGDYGRKYSGNYLGAGYFYNSSAKGSYSVSFKHKSEGFLGFELGAGYSPGYYASAGMFITPSRPGRIYPEFHLLFGYATAYTKSFSGSSGERNYSIRAREYFSGYPSLVIRATDIIAFRISAGYVLLSGTSPVTMTSGDVGFFNDDLSAINKSTASRFIGGIEIDFKLGKNGCGTCPTWK